MNDILKACEILKNGGVVGIPTETVYGLAGSIESSEGIDNIFTTKERPFFDPLIVHVCSIEQAKKYTPAWNHIADKLAKNLWPGPMTLILPKNHLISDKITSGLDSVGLRYPSHPVAIELIKTLGHPVAAPSANKFKKTSPTNSEHVRKEFPYITVLEGGPCEVGIESTVLGIFSAEIKIYRPGMLTKEKLQEIIDDDTIKISYVESPVAPGHLKHHYMPNTPVIVQTSSKSLNDIPSELLKDFAVWQLPLNANIAARELYAKFRELDQDKKSSIIVKITEEQKNSEDFFGIINRLQKASSYFI